MTEVEYEIMIGETYAGIVSALVEAEIADYADASIEVTAVYSVAFNRSNPNTPGLDMLASADPFVSALGRWIKDKAEADETVQSDAFDRAGGRYIGRGGNDPDGRYVWEEN
jgi:dihydroorotate dehydrogenase